MSELTNHLTPDQDPEAWSAAASEYSANVWDYMTPYVRDVIERARLSRDHELLDVAAGSGRITLEAAPRVRRVLATDFAAGMLEQLGSRLQELGYSNVELAQMDGQALDLADATFDRVTSNFGVIFFPDQVKGFSEMHRVLRPGGRAVVTAWSVPERFDVFRLFGEALRAALPELEMPPPPIFSLAEPGKLAATMQAGGFDAVEVETVTHQYTFESAQGFWELMSRSAPPAVALLNTLDDEQRARVEDAVIGRVREVKGAGEVTTSDEALIGVGIR